MRENYELVQALSEAFSLWPRPCEIITLRTVESEEIQKEFGKLDREEMSYEQAANLIIDSALLSDEALCYFLPRSAKAALVEGGNALLLFLRLRRLNKDILNDRQLSLFHDLENSLEDQICLMESTDQEELEEGRYQWREGLVKSGKIEDHLLLAIADGNMDEVKRLVSLGAAINIKDRNGNTAVSIARMFDREDVILFLESRGRLK